MDWYGSNDTSAGALLPDPSYGLLSFDQGWDTMAMVGARLTPRTGLLELYLSKPWSVTGPYQAKHVMRHPEFCGMLVSHSAHDALMRYKERASPFWFFQLPSWQVDGAVSEMLFEAGNPPRPDNHALLASLAASLNMLFPRATVHQAVMRQAVMRHFGIPVGKGHAASKQGTLKAVQSLVGQGRLEFVGDNEATARHLLSWCDHVGDALLQTLYHWGHLAQRVVVHGPMSPLAFVVTPMPRGAFEPPPSWRPVS